MKYLRYFEEENTEIDLEQFKDDVEKVFENNEWLVVKPKSFEALLYWGQGTEWRITDINTRYYPGTFKPQKYDLNDKVYININKSDDKKYLFDFYRSYFYDEDEDDVYLKDFFETNNDLFNFYGEVLDCNNIVKENGEYWIAVEGYSYFESFFKLDNRTRDDLVKDILGDDYYCNYGSNDFDLEQYGIEFDEENLEIIKILLMLEKLDNDYDYDIEDITDYDDVVSIIKEYELDDLKTTFLVCICDAHERADMNAAWEDVTKEIYSFFELSLENGSPKWDNFKNNKNQYLFIRFKTPSDAYLAKFRINNYDDSYSDDVIEYSPPYNGYDGETKDVNETFNEALPERLPEYYSNWDEVDKNYDAWKEMKKENPNISIDDSELMDKIKLKLDAKKYNL